MSRNNRRSAAIPRVIVVVSMQSNYGPSVLRGIFTHIATHGEWAIQIMRSANELTVQAIADAVASNVDGIILALSEECSAYQALSDSPLPFVTIETYSDTLARRTQRAHHIRLDNVAIGCDAAQSFLRQGRYASFGFVAPRQACAWSHARKEGFAKALQSRARPLNVFSNEDTLEAWLQHLEKPAAVFAADDSVAFEVIQACQHAHIKIPDDVAVLGVDDEPFLCESVRPTLSSVRPPFARAGLMAAEAIERLIRQPSKPLKPSISIVNGPNKIITRASTRPESSAGLLVQEAIAFIQANAQHGIRIKDIQNHLHVSRALMDLRFRQIRGESVLSVLTEVRLRELKRALASSSEPIGEITARLGWKSPNYPKRLFKAKFGRSMSSWRKKHGYSASR